MQGNKHNVQAPLLDRLLDDEPEISSEPVQQRIFNAAQLKASVIRDLENLLNTRRHIVTPPEKCEETGSSLFTYGLKDFTAQSPKSPAVRRQLRQEISRVISLFEPRLKKVSVRLEEASLNERNLRFRITGVLNVEPVAEPIAFDTFFDINRGEYIIPK